MKISRIYLVNLLLVLCMSTAQAVMQPEFGACFFPKKGMPEFVLFWQSTDDPRNENSDTSAAMSYDFTNKQGLPKSAQMTTIIGIRKKLTGHDIHGHKVTTLHIGEMAQTGQLIQYAKLKFVNNDIDNLKGEITYDDEITGEAMCVIRNTQEELIKAIENHKNKQLLTNPMSVCASFPKTIASVMGVLLMAYLCS
ncbi:MAG: hypothetical protein K0R49_504 [Burkholderiales bacterium]|jgi:hypothetical protein|nr:hypothetical protein [Burkholderiales bacterium]